MRRNIPSIFIGYITAGKVAVVAAVFAVAIVVSEIVMLPILGGVLTSTDLTHDCLVVPEHVTQQIFHLLKLLATILAGQWGHLMVNGFYMLIQAMVGEVVLFVETIGALKYYLPLIICFDHPSPPVMLVESMDPMSFECYLTLRCEDTSLFRALVHLDVLVLVQCSK